MTAGNRKYIIILFAGLILLLSGVGSSFYWLTRIYLPDQIDANANARKMKEWEAADSFVPPVDGRITRRQLHLFIQVNESFTFLLRRLQNQFENHSWRIAFDMIEVQPEWAASKYLALKKHGLSPHEYNWILDQVVTFMIHRWKEKTKKKLQEFGWNFPPRKDMDDDLVTNYELFTDNEKELQRMFEWIWPEAVTPEVSPGDSL